MAEQSKPMWAVTVNGRLWERCSSRRDAIRMLKALAHNKRLKDASVAVFGPCGDLIKEKLPCKPEKKRIKEEHPMGKAEKRPRKYDTEPLVDLIRFFVRKNGGVEVMERCTDLKRSTYYGRNQEPDDYHLGELRALMIAYDIPKEYILDAVDKALTG